MEITSHNDLTLPSPSQERGRGEVELSIIIVTYKCREVFKGALLALEQSKVNFNFEVIVIDNDSRDGTVEMIKGEFLTKDFWNDRLVLFENTNEGFPKGNNRGIRMKRGRYVLLLNPDTAVREDTLQVMMDLLKTRSDIGIATCKLVKANGELDKACKRNLPNPISSLFRLSGLSLIFPHSKIIASYNIGDLSDDQESQIGACVGAFMFVSPECLDKIGLMDERFYMYGEDLDWCARANEAGFKIWYYPKTTTIHYKGQSSGRRATRSLYAFHQAMWLYYKKYWSKKLFYLLDPFVWSAVWSRFAVKVIINSFRKKPYVSK